MSDREISCKYTEDEFSETGDLLETLLSIVEDDRLPEAVRAIVRGAAAKVEVELKLMEAVGIEYSDELELMDVDEDSPRWRR